MYITITITELTNQPGLKQQHQQQQKRNKEYRVKKAQKKVQTFLSTLFFSSETPTPPLSDLPKHCELRFYHTYSP